MSLRRPSLRSTLYMVLMALGIVFVGQLIFRGAGAPPEPARIVAPGSRTVRLDTAGRYIVFVEQVIAAEPTRLAELREPTVTLEVTDPAGAVVALTPAGFDGWLFKFLTKNRGHSLGVFEAPAPGDYRVKAELSAVAGHKPDRGVVMAFAPVASPARFLWLLLGFGGQIFFTLRFLVQWLASEKAGRSVIPRAFWYYSVVGGLMILAYAIQTRDPVFILAYAFSAFIYVRNLILLRREDERQNANPET